MFRKLKIFGALILCAGYVSSASADILIEPYLGYYTGKMEQSGTPDTKFNGAGFGARLGYKHMLGVMFGLDYMTGKMQSDDTPKSDLTPSQFGVFVGYEFPILLRVYGVYNFSDQVKAETSGSPSFTYKGDQGVKLGVGFTALPLLSINLEYAMSTYDKAGSISLPDSLKVNTYGLSVSLPFTL
jgi:hypothetical protein